MRQIFAITLSGILILGAIALDAAAPASAQGIAPTAPGQTAPGLPPAPTPTPGISGPYAGPAAENFLVTSAANEQGSYLWIVAPVQHLVILCQKFGDAKDFSCISKRMP